MSGHKIYLTIIALLVIGSAGVYLWTNHQMDNLREGIAEQHAAVIAQANQRMADKAADLLRLSAIPLTWTVRTEAMRGNLEQVDQYLTEFIKEPSIEQALYVGADSVIAVATDKNLEGMAFSSRYPAALLREDRVTVSEEGDQLRLVAPVMGLNSKLGTLIMTYSTDDLLLPAPTDSLTSTK